MVLETFGHIRSILSDNSLTLLTKIEDIIKLEDDLLQNSSLDRGFSISMSMCSIARYSSVLWAPTNQGGLGYEDKVYNGMKRPDWHEVAVDDVFGACTAAFTTANPFVALGWGCVDSGWTILKGYI